MTKILGSVDYNDGNSKGWRIMTVRLPDELQEIYNYGVNHEYSPKTSKKLQDYLPVVRKEIEEQLIDEMIKGKDRYVIDLCGGRLATPEEIIDAVTDRDICALSYYGLENATDEEIENWNNYPAFPTPQLRDIYESYGDKSPFNDGWELYVEYYDPAVEEH